MKKLFIALIVMIVSLPVSAEFIVHLKNGRKFSGVKHWVEGNQVKLKTQQGVIGIPKRLVNRIENTGQISADKIEVIKNRQSHKKAFPSASVPTTNQLLNPEPDQSAMVQPQMETKKVEKRNSGGDRSVWCQITGC